MSASGTHNPPEFKHAEDMESRMRDFSNTRRARRSRCVPVEFFRGPARCDTRDQLVRLVSWGTGLAPLLANQRDRSLVRVTD
jgi:hypothetical protein